MGSDIKRNLESCSWLLEQNGEMKKKDKGTFH